MLAIGSWDSSNTEPWMNVNSGLTINILVLRASCLGYCDCINISTSGASLGGEAATGTTGVASRLPTVPLLWKQHQHTGAGPSLAGGGRGCAN